MPLKIAIVGCGKIADGHIEEIQKMPETAQVVAVCDLEILMAEQIAMRYRIPHHYDSYERMLEVDRPDVVHIATPPGSHLALTKMAVDAGCHVYVEKPLTLNLADSKKLVDYVTAHDRKLTLGYTYLFDPPAMAMRELIAAGVVGDPVHVEYNLSGPFGAAILGDPSHWVHRLPGKLFHNNIDHMLNKLPEFIDDDEPRVTAFGYARRQGRHGDSRDELLDELRVTIQGARTSAYATFSSHARPAGHFVRVYGTKNTVHVDYLARTVTLPGSSSLPAAIGRLLPAFNQAWQYFREGGRNAARFARSDFHFFSGLHRLLALYYASILDNGPPPISYRDMLRVSAMMDEIFRQVRQGGDA
jgi:predicted dehydrogenase